MAFDGHANLAASLVATAPSPATSGTSLVITAASGTFFPAVPFNATIWPAGTAAPTHANGEIVRVTAISTDTLTIARAQEGTSARTVIVGDQIAATVTAKTLTDVEAIAGGVTGTTGTGNVVRATSPALVTPTGIVTSDISGYGVVSDSVFTIQDNLDPTKQMKFELAFLPTATTITLSPGPTSGAIATLDDAISANTLWDAAGDLAVGTGANTGGKLTTGTVAGTALIQDPSAANKVGWDSPLSTSDANASATALVSTYNRLITPSSATVTAQTSGTLYLYGITLPRGITVSNLTVWAGTVAGALLTHSWMAISTATRLQKAISADNTTATWGASTSRTFAMTTPFVTTSASFYYIWLMIAGTTIPTIEAVTGLLATGSRNVSAALKAGGATSDTGLTTPAGAPSTAAAISPTATWHIYCEVS